LGQGQLHRAFSVFLFNGNGELLMQQRSADKMLWGGFWSNTVCSHPRKDEELMAAAQRRITQEFGVTSPDLRHVYAFVYRAPFRDVGSEHEYCHVFIGHTKDQPRPHAQEISAWRFVNTEELLRDVQTQPERYTPWFLKEIQELRRRKLFPPAV
jgi:isopentenyl-diphosphate delta-isomerase